MPAPQSSYLSSHTPSQSHPPVHSHSHSHSPPRSPSHAPRASWGGGDVSVHEAGTIGHRDEARRKKDELRAILDAQVRERQAMGVVKETKSTKYALRHRERQAELAAEQQRQSTAVGMQNNIHGAHPTNSSPPNVHHGDVYASQGRFPPHQQPTHPYQHHPSQFQQPPMTYPPHPSPSVVSNLSASPHDPSTDKQRAQNEFRLALAEQVAEKERVKQRAKEEKEMEDRIERIRLGIEPNTANKPSHDSQSYQQYPPSHPQYPPGYPSNYPPGNGSPPHPSHSHSHSDPSHSSAQFSLSPTRAAENRSRQMQSNIFTGGGGAESEAEKKARERALAQAALADQIESKRAAAAALKRAEAEIERRDEERLARDRLEMLSRYQGLDPQAAAAKAQQTIEAAKQREAELQQQQQQHSNHRSPSHLQIPSPSHRHQQQQQQSHGIASVSQPSGLLSPSSAKTLVANPNFASGDGGVERIHRPEFDHVPISLDPDDAAAAEENIAKLTALTSAMNRKVENRRARAQQFEDSAGLIEDESERSGRGRGRNGVGPNLDEYEEVPRRKDGVAVAGRRGGKQGPSNKGGSSSSSSKSSKKVVGSGAGPSRLRERSQTRERDRDRLPPSSRSTKSTASSSSTSKKKIASAQEREREREFEVRAAAERRKASILARARKEVEEEDDEDDDDERNHRRKGSSKPRRHAISSASGVGDRERRARISSASVSTTVVGDSRSRRMYPTDRDEFEPDDDNEFEVEVHPYDRSESDSDPPSSSRLSRHESRIPIPRVQSGRKRRPLSVVDDIGTRHRSPSSTRVNSTGQRRSATAAPANAQRRALSRKREQSPQPPGERTSKSRKSAQSMKSAHRASSVASNHLEPDYGHYSSSHSPAARFSPHPNPPPNGVTVGQYPWFAQAVAANVPLDVSLNGNSAFILLPNSSTHIPSHHAHSGVATDERSHTPLVDPSHSASTLARSSYGDHAVGDDDGIAADELEKLLQSYGQSGLELFHQPIATNEPTVEPLVSPSISPPTRNSHSTGSNTRRSKSSRPPTSDQSTNSNPPPPTHGPILTARASAALALASLEGSSAFDERHHDGVPNPFSPLSGGIVGESLDETSTEWIQGGSTTMDYEPNAGGFNPHSSHTPAFSPSLKSSQSQSNLSPAKPMRPMPRVGDPFAQVQQI